MTLREDLQDPVGSVHHSTGRRSPAEWPRWNRAQLHVEAAFQLDARREATRKPRAKAGLNAPA